MNNLICARESEVVHAMKSRQWTSELQAHAARCSICGVTVEATLTLQELIADPAEVTPPVSYRLLWLRAQSTRRQGQLSRLERISLIGAFFALVLALGGALFWKWQAVRSWVSVVATDPGGHMSLYIVVGCAAFLWLLTEELFKQDT